MKHLGPLFLSLFLINFQKTAANPNQYPDYDASFSYSEYQVDDTLNSEYSGKDHFQIVFSQKSITCSIHIHTHFFLGRFSVSRKLQGVSWRCPWLGIHH